MNRLSRSHYSEKCHNDLVGLCLEKDEQIRQLAEKVEGYKTLVLSTKAKSIPSIETDKNGKVIRVAGIPV